MVMVSSWGRLGQWEHDVLPLTERGQVPRLLQASAPGLAHGMGRSYGDVCLNPGGVLWRSTGLDRFISFDRETGLLRCESGVLLRDIQKLAVQSGWMLPVTPGTQLVTVGGAIANDVHGKNHHSFGSFGDHVRRIELLRTDGQRIECGSGEQENWFAATVGGLGLTGIICTAEIQLRRVAGPWLETETLPYASLDEFFVHADASEANWEHTVSWIDCLSRRGRGIFLRANHCAAQGLEIPAARPSTMPFVPPVSLVNRLSLAPFNSAYFNLQKSRAGKRVAHYEGYFYPLDNLLEWNRMYGPKGFYQYQSVVPRAVGRVAVLEMLKAIADSGEGSFLAVLKTFGERQAPGMLSFAQPGVTLALDFPNRNERTLRLFERLDAIVAEAGGRIYMAKDARMPRSLFESGYPRLAEFLSYRDPGISSAMSRRLMGN
ncbi:FAD-binding protein [Pseudoduganella eburnea]|uniref:FAD-binding protein n=1 Tax=Massilia eburnea TaxID=1776165 RepID=A0A6L6QPG7_9BURK|nr:FAD-binding protein [Massilia eburnea]